MEKLLHHTYRYWTANIHMDSKRFRRIHFWNVKEKNDWGQNNRRQAHKRDPWKRNWARAPAGITDLPVCKLHKENF